MITAKNVRYMIDIPIEHLNAICVQNKIKLIVADSKFLGITNGGEFCYTVTFQVKGGTDSGKVFVKQDPVTGKVIATPELTVWEN